MTKVQHILVPTDFNACSTRARELAVSMATALRAKLTLTNVVDVAVTPYAGAPFMPPVDLASERLLTVEAELEALLSTLPPELEPTFVVRRGGAAREIVALAEELGVDLIVMGTHGYTGLARAFLGSVAEKVVRLSPIPVLTVHAAKPAAEAD